MPEDSVGVDDVGAEPHRLTRQLRLGDLVLAQILCVVGSAWVGVAAGLGRAQAVVWIAAMVLFYLPMAVSVYFLIARCRSKAGSTCGRAVHSETPGAS